MLYLFVLPFLVTPCLVVVVQPGFLVTPCLVVVVQQSVFLFALEIDCSKNKFCINIEIVAS